MILESFIWFEDDVGQQLHAALLAAAQRGVKAEVLLDGYGSDPLRHGISRCCHFMASLLKNLSLLTRVPNFTENSVRPHLL